MTNLEKFIAVNNCETIEELIRLIKLFANKDGEIKGRRKLFNAEKMAKYAKIYFDDKTGMCTPNIITREFGLRQQAMYLKYYK